MIDHVIIPNLDRHPERWAYMLGTLHHAGFPIRDKKIAIRFSSHDGKDYKNPIEVCDVAMVDGFDFFEEVKQCGWAREDRFKYYTAWLWTWASILKVIINMKDKTVMFMIDDIVPAPSWNWMRFNNMINELNGAAATKDNGKFRILQLSYPLMKAHLPPIKNEQIVGRGLTGENDFALIINAEGAKLLSDVQRIRPDRHPSIHLTYITYREKEDPKRYLEGLWHTLDNIVENGYYHNYSDIGI